MARGVRACEEDGQADNDDEAVAGDVAAAVRRHASFVHIRRDDQKLLIVRTRS